MRLLKTFGLAALAAMAAMAIVGAGTASATTTVMCKVNLTPCPVESIFTQGTHGTETGTKIEAKAASPQLKIYKGATQVEIENEIACSESKVVGWYQEKGTQEAPQHKGEITALSFTGCVVKGVAFSHCETPGQANGTIVGTQLPYQTLLSQTEGQNGKLIIYEQGASGQPGARIECTVPFLGKVLDCTFKVAETDEQVAGSQNVGRMQVTGGEPPVITASQLELKWGEPGTICPTSTTKAKWDAEYKATTPTKGWVSQQES